MKASVRSVLRARRPVNVRLVLRVIATSVRRAHRATALTVRPALRVMPVIVRLVARAVIPLTAAPRASRVTPVVIVPLAHRAMPVTVRPVARVAIRPIAAPRANRVMLVVIVLLVLRATALIVRPVARAAMPVRTVRRARLRATVRRVKKAPLWPSVPASRSRASRSPSAARRLLATACVRASSAKCQR